MDDQQGNPTEGKQLPGEQQTPGQPVQQPPAGQQQYQPPQPPQQPPGEQQTPGQPVQQPPAGQQQYQTPQPPQQPPAGQQEYQPPQPPPGQPYQYPPGQEQPGYQQPYYQQPPGGYGPPPGQPGYGGAQPPRKGMSKGKAIGLGILITVLVIGAIAGLGLVLQRTVFNTAANFKLEDEPAYREALFNIKSYYFKPYSEAKITAAANAAVAKDKKKGVKSEAQLTNTGITALVKALGDTHSNYLTPTENRRLEQDLSGTFYGVGFTLRLDKQRPKVVTIIKGSPSDKAGVKANDVIMSVDGKDTKGEGLDSVVLRIRGRQGTKVKLKIMRGTKQMDFTITREKIQVPDFESELQDNKYGVLKLYEFNKDVGQKVRNAVKDLQAKGAQGFILDLRNDPGGLLDEAVKTASVFIPDGVIVSYQTKGQKKVDEFAQGGAETAKPLVVLVNGGSASSSEIVSGALKDHKRAVLVGTKTYGKGSVQKVFDLGNDGAAKLTISLYYLPNGESIDGKGIEPDITVEVKNDPAVEEQQQMDKAKQVLQNLIDGKPATGLLEETALAA